MVSAHHSTALEWDGHVLLLHRSEAERASGLAAWVRRGLDRDEKVFLTGPGPGRSALVTLLREGVDVAASTADGRLCLLMPGQLNMDGEHRRLVDSALAEGFHGVRVTAETMSGSAGLQAAEHAVAERTLDALCRAQPVSVLCQYAWAGASGDLLRPVAGAHSGGLRDRLLRTTELPGGGIALVGEIDMTNDELLESALHGATAHLAGTFRIDMRDLTIISASGCRGLLAGTSAFRSRRGRLRLVNPRPIVGRVLILTDVVGQVGVELVGAGR